MSSPPLPPQAQLGAGHERSAADTKSEQVQVCAMWCSKREGRASWHRVLEQECMMLKNNWQTDFQWLNHRAPKVKGTGSIPGGGTKIPHAPTA